LNLIQATSYPRNKIKILLLEGVHPITIEEFKKAGYDNIETFPGALEEAELIKKIEDVHILGIRSKTRIDEKILSSAKKLLEVGAFCIGTNQVDLETAKKNGVAVFNSPFSNTRSVAELVIANAIMLLRRIPEKNEAAHKGLWLKDSKNCFEIRGKTIGIIGYGHIGSQVSVLAESLGLKVLYYDVESKLALGNAQPIDTLDEVLSNSDIVTLHVPGTSLTKNIINADGLNKMKKGAILINLSRGDVIETNAVKDALKEGQLGGLAVDVFPDEPQSKGDTFISPFQGLANVILTPHIGGSTQEAQKRIGADVAGKLINFLNNGSTMGSLSVPALNLPVQQDAHRLLHIHHNVPGVLSEINGLLSKLNVNILGQYLKTNDKIGYVVLDIDKINSVEVLTELKKVKNTIKVRDLY
jgi:D-3-phosphoglycerate dehydrogenase / 2-oxoglutarate reductase